MQQRRGQLAVVGGGCSRAGAGLQWCEVQVVAVQG